MKILIVTPRFKKIIGGGERSVRLLATHLKKRGMHVGVLSFDGKGTETIEDVAVTMWPLRFPLKELDNLFYLSRIRNFAKNWDIVHAYNMNFNMAVALLSIAKFTKTVVTLNAYFYRFYRNVCGVRGWNVWQKSYHTVADPLWWRIVKKADRFVAQSDCTRSIYREFIGIPPEKIVTIPNMIDEKFLKPKNSVSKKKPKTVLYVGALIPQRKVDDLIHAFAKVKCDAALWIVGGGNQLPSLRELTVKLGIENKVEFLAGVPHDELSHVYSQASLYVSTFPTPEPYPRSVLEAMQMGLPVIRLGIEAEKSNLHEKITWLLNCDKTRERIGLQNQEYVHRKHSPEIILKEYVGLYKDLLK